MSLSSVAKVIKHLFKTIFELDRNVKLRFYLAISVSVVGLFCSMISPLFLREIINSLESKNIAFGSLLLTTGC